jgi:membrane protease YdiL (CAAX protease family)
MNFDQRSVGADNAAKRGGTASGPTGIGHDVDPLVGRSLAVPAMGRTRRSKTSTATLIGLAIALFSIPVFTTMYRASTGENHSNWQVLGKELGIFLLVGTLLWIVKRRELQQLTSIGLHVNRWRTSLVRGLWLAVIVLVITVGLYLLLRAVGIHLGEDPGNAFHPSLLIVTVSVLRAGVAEETFYRGFAIERLQRLTGSKVVAALVPLVIFAAAHYRQGLGGVIAALVLGGVLTASYMKFRDLLANITAHSLGDFVLNVALPLVGGG